MENTRPQILYQIILEPKQKTVSFEHDEFMNTSFSECREKLEESETYIKYMVDYGSGAMMCNTSKGANMSHHVFAIRAIIESIYMAYKEDNVAAAEQFKQLLIMSVNDPKFWNEIERDMKIE